jgi:predicted transcriptional regulator
MKLEEKKKAILLREKGYSITTIARRLKVSKASVSGWVKDVNLSKETMTLIQRRSHSAVAVEKRRLSRLTNENSRRSIVKISAQNEVSKISEPQLFLIGIALYWGEGSKKKRGVVEFTNSDPKMIQVMKKFFTEVCKVPADKFRGHVYLHEHIDIERAEKYWSDIANIPRKQFHKTSVQHNKKRIQKDTLPYGTFAIVICDTRLKLSMDGWTEGLYRNTLHS